MIVRRKDGIGTCMSHSPRNIRALQFIVTVVSTMVLKAGNIVGAQPEKYGKDFDANMSYFCQMVTKKGYNK